MTLMTSLCRLLGCTWCCCRCLLALGIRFAAGVLAVILTAATFELRFRVDQVTTGNRNFVTRLEAG